MNNSIDKRIAWIMELVKRLTSEPENFKYLQDLIAIELNGLVAEAELKGFREAKEIINKWRNI